MTDLIILTLSFSFSLGSFGLIILFMVANFFERLALVILIIVSVEVIVQIKAKICHVFLMLQNKFRKVYTQSSVKTHRLL